MIYSRRAQHDEGKDRQEEKASLGAGIVLPICHCALEGSPSGNKKEDDEAEGGAVRTCTVPPSLPILPTPPLLSTYELST